MQIYFRNINKRNINAVYEEGARARQRSRATKSGVSPATLFYTLMSRGISPGNISRATARWSEEIVAFEPGGKWFCSELGRWGSRWIMRVINIASNAQGRWSFIPLRTGRLNFCYASWPQTRVSLYPIYALISHSPRNATETSFKRHSQHCVLSYPKPGILPMELIYHFIVSLRGHIYMRRIFSTSTYYFKRVSQRNA